MVAMQRRQMPGPPPCDMSNRIQHVAQIEIGTRVSNGAQIIMVRGTLLSSQGKIFCFFVRGSTQLRSGQGVLEYNKMRDGTVRVFECDFICYGERAQYG